MNTFHTKVICNLPNGHAATTEIQYGIMAQEWLDNDIRSNLQNFPRVRCPPAPPQLLCTYAHNMLCRLGPYHLQTAL